jgi:hypothetical protein
VQTIARLHEVGLATTAYQTGCPSHRHKIFIRSCEAGQRHLEVRLGNVETSAGARQVFAAVARTDTAVEVLIRRGLAAVGQTDKTTMTAVTDGCSGLRSILADAGITAPPFLDWFHIAMRLHHAETTAGNLPANTPERERAKAVIVEQIERLHWRIWNGKAKNAQITLERIRTVMPAFQSEQGSRKRDPSLHRLWTALREIDRYLTSQSAWLINYAERHRAGLRVGTALTEGTANFLVNRRMNKSQQGPDAAPISCSSAPSSTASSAPASDSSSRPKPILLQT